MTKNSQTISDLRQQGYQVFITHQRPCKEVSIANKTQIKKNHYTPYPKGGKCTAEIYKDGELLSEGEAHCCTLDNYSYRIATSIALGRCLKNMKNA